MNHIQSVAFSRLYKDVIQHLTRCIEAQGYRPVIHFELEGVFDYLPNSNPITDFSAINHQLRALDIDGVLVDEYWKNQWEYVSLFNHQSPLKEATNLAQVMRLLPDIVKPYGVSQVLFDPVVWGGDSGRYLPGSKAIFAVESAPVHIPNAIQVNVSVEDNEGKNAVADSFIGEWIQYSLLSTGYNNSLIFLPEADAFERIKLRSRYGLDAELCSPFSLSSGHQGSIALYKKIGKHNQLLGIEPTLIDINQQAISYQINWEKTARVEHRLGATSKFYDPFINMIYILMNILNALQLYKQQSKLPPQFEETDLPVALYDQGEQRGAVALFEADDWFSATLNQFCGNMTTSSVMPIGDVVKHNILRRYVAS